MSNYTKVCNWHDKFNVPLAYEPALLTDDRRLLRKKLIEEEQEELFKAMADEDMVEIADGLADLLYVVYGTAAEYGIDIDAVFTEVQRSNLSKLGEDGKPIYRDDGKVLKGPNFFPPNIRAVLIKQGWDGN